MVYSLVRACGIRTEARLPSSLLGSRMTTSVFSRITMRDTGFKNASKVQEVQKRQLMTELWAAGTLTTFTGGNVAARLLVEAQDHGLALAVLFVANTFAFCGLKKTCKSLLNDLEDDAKTKEAAKQASENKAVKETSK